MFNSRFGVMALCSLKVQHALQTRASGFMDSVSSTEWLSFCAYRKWLLPNHYCLLPSVDYVSSTEWFSFCACRKWLLPNHYSLLPLMDSVSSKEWPAFCACREWLLPNHYCLLPSVMYGFRVKHGMTHSGALREVFTWNDYCLITIA